MKAYPVERIRNIGLFSHGGAGKTSLSEAMLYSSKAISRLGRVEDGNTTSDWDPEEARRSMSISTAIVPLEWRDHKINILDTPGYSDFVGEVKCAMRVVDCALIVVDASAGAEVGTEYAWSFANERSVPRIVVVNKIDRENADFDQTLQSLQTSFGSDVVPAYLPIGQESTFSGVVDLLAMRAYTFGDEVEGDATEGDVPDSMLDAAETYRLQLVEKIAENDEDLMLRYLEDDELSIDELRAALKVAVASGLIVPVLTAAATTNRGVDIVLDTLVDLAPAPQVTHGQDERGKAVEIFPSADGPVVAFVWKTIADPYVGKLSYFGVMSGTLKSDSHIWNISKGVDERIGQLFIMRGKEQITAAEIGPGDIGAVSKLGDTSSGDTLCDPSFKFALDGITYPTPLFSASVTPHSKSDLDKMGQALARLADEDPTIHISRDAETAEMIISGLGESHVQIALERMSRKFGVNVDFDLPTVPYRETIMNPVQKIEYKHKKQSGGHGQYGHVYLDICPSEEVFEFAETIFGGSVPRQYIPAVEKGVREAMEEGILAGFPVINVKVTLTDGSYHTVDSSEMAFKMAAIQAFRKGAESAHPVILEPINELHVTIPDTYTGDVMSDLTSKRAHVTGMVPGENGHSTIEAEVPAAEVQRYATDLRSITQGRGTFTTAFSHYQQVPAHLTDTVIQTVKAKQEARV